MRRSVASEVGDGGCRKRCRGVRRGNRLVESDPGGARDHERATYEDVLNAPENKVAEIVDGELVTSPRPAPPHALAGI